MYATICGMEEPKQIFQGDLEGSKADKIEKLKTKRTKKNKSKREGSSPQDNDLEVLLKIGRFQYKMPGKRQRVFIAGLVLGLNLLLVIAVALYFYSSAFHDFIYNVGRN